LPQPAGPPGAPLPHDTVYGADSVDTQPEPLDQPAPEYPSWARSAGEAAVVVARFVVTAQGGVADVQVRVTEGDPRFAAAVRAALAQWRFRPATKAGIAVAVRAEQEFRFDLLP